MAWNTPDISVITDALKDLLQTAINNSVGAPLHIPHFNVGLNLGSPETARTGNDCQLTLYLMHVGRDASWRNTPQAGPRPQLNTAQPLSLNLYYLLTAWADKNYHSEQQAMSIALQAFHSQPIYRLPATSDEFTISIEADTIEEMSRLWQAFTTPMRLSCVVKVGVIFITPAALPPPPAIPPSTANIAVGPTPGPTDPVALYAAMNLRFAPYPAPSDPTKLRVSGGELVAVASGAAATSLHNSNIALRGAGLDQPAAAKTFLSTPDGLSEWPLAAAWRNPVIDPGLLSLTVPTTYVAALPAAGTSLAKTPPPGVYRLAVGQGASVRSNRIPLTIAARLDSVSGPATATAGAVYTVSAAGLAAGAGATTVALGAIVLTSTAAATPAAGKFVVNAAAGTIKLALPNPLPPKGDYAVGVTVNGVPSPPDLVVTI